MPYSNKLLHLDEHVVHISTYTAHTCQFMLKAQYFILILTLAGSCIRNLSTPKHLEGLLVTDLNIVSYGMACSGIHILVSLIDSHVLL